MLNIWNSLFIGSLNDCFHIEKADWAIIHACKHPCHLRIIGYKGSLPKSHPYYLKYRIGSHLYLNLIDPEQPLFYKESFIYALDFIDEFIETRSILVHCNQSFSRAPSIAMLYLAKRVNIIPNDSFSSAMKEFCKMVPAYSPSVGIFRFLENNWNIIY